MLAGVLQAGCGDNMFSTTTCHEAHLFVRGTQPAPIVKARVDNSEWFEIAPSKSRLNEWRYSVCSEEAYSFILGCRGSLGVNTVVQFDATPAEFVSIEQSCGSVAPGGLSLQGKMKQPGWVRVGSMEQERPWNDWSFKFLVDRGAYDLVAGADNELVVRHGVEVVSDSIVPDIDVTVEGRSMLDRSVAIADITTDALLVIRSTLLTVNGTRATLPRTVNDHILVPDPDQLSVGDAVYVDVSAYEEMSPLKYWRSNVQRVVDFDNIDVELLPRLSPNLVPTGSPPAVDASAIPADDWNYADISYQADEVEKYRRVTSGWLSLHRDLEPRLDISTDLGPEWDAVGDYHPSFTLRHSTATSLLSTSIGPSQPF
ncbi:MAG TPA: hypothetical protein VM513_32680 [Kofleriaceae bacterium]|nr:hypothetical protein [Kofleriaceae bacterium]